MEWGTVREDRVSKYVSGIECDEIWDLEVQIEDKNRLLCCFLIYLGEHFANSRTVLDIVGDLHNVWNS